MGFRLRVRVGADLGSFSLEFSRMQVRLGRAADNDLVIKDERAAEYHARITALAGLYFLEDLGSPAGTLLNERRVAGTEELGSGDVISIGQYRVTFLDPDEAEPPSRSTKAAVSRAPLEDSADSRVDSDDEAPAFDEQAGVSTVLLSDTSGALAAASRALATPPRETAPHKVGRNAFDVSAPNLFEVEARRRAPRWRRPSLRAVAAMLAAFVGMTGALLYIFLRPTGVTYEAPADEATRLSYRPLEQSFGLGEGVQVAAPDRKTFSFEVAAPTRAFAILHYQSRDMADGEVRLSVNGRALGSVPADRVDTELREHERVIAADLLEQPGDNALVFDNQNNPPRADPWRVWNLWVEVVPLPQLPAEELGRMATRELERADRYQKEVARSPDALFRAWQSYRNAWLLLEGLPERPEPYRMAKSGLEDTAAQLLKQCRRLVLEARRALELRKPARARAALDALLKQFPAREHRCHRLARREVEALGD